MLLHVELYNVDELRVIPEITFTLAVCPSLGDHHNIMLLGHLYSVYNEMGLKAFCKHK